MTQQQETETTSSIFVNDKGEQILDKKRLPHNYLFIAPAFMAAIQIAATKLGYTTQNPNARIQQWRNESPIYEDIQLVAVHPAYFDTDNGERVYYLDHALHRLLELKHNYSKLIKVPSVVQQFPNDKISQEFYYNLLDNQKRITAEKLQEMHNDLKTMYEMGTAPSGVKFYTDFVSSATPIARNFLPVHNFPPRLFQEETIDKSASYLIEKYQKASDATTAVEKTILALEKSFLLSAPTRSGKSFMAAMISKRIVEHLAQCGKTQNVVLVVSGIADVIIEWQKAYQEHIAFNQKNPDGTGKTLFQFITRTELQEKGVAALDEAFENGAENVVIALTLQDLSGSFKKSKNEHFIAHDFLKPREDGRNPVDFLIVDEAHFAAFNRYGEYRKMIAPEDHDESTNKIAQEPSDEPLSEDEFQEAVDEFQHIDPTVGTLYVSATPYNEILGGNTFSVERGNMHAISPGDIKRESEQWTRENPDAPEWLSPYYGLPQRHYFGIDPGLPIDEVLAVDADGEFIRYDDAHSLIWNFVGYKFNDTFQFPRILTDPEYVKAGLGKHILITVGSCAEADAVEASLNMLMQYYAKVAEEYRVLNFSSESSSHFYRSKTSYDIAQEIEQAEHDGIKTISITVDRLGTGVTVEEWDTVVFWRRMESAQKFDQMAGRVGTPHVVSMQDEDGNVIKRCEKQNTAVLSYAPDQMLEIVYKNALTVARVKEDEEAKQQKRSRKTLTDLIEDELSVLPTYMLDGGDVMVRMDANNILDSVLASLQGKGPRDYAQNVAVDLFSILQHESILGKMNQVDADEKGPLSVTIEAFETPEPKEGECHQLNCEADAIESHTVKYGNTLCEKHLVMKQLQDRENAPQTPPGGTSGDSGSNPPVTPDTVPPSVVKEAQKELDELQQRARNFVSILLMFVALSPQAERSLKDVIASIEDTTNLTGARIAHHLGIDVEFLKELEQAGIFNYTLDMQFHLINKTLENIDADSTIDDIWEAMAILIQGFGSFSANEIPTTDKAARLLLDKAGLTDGFWEDAARKLENNESIADVFHQVVPGTDGDSSVSVHSRDGKIRFIDNGCKSAIIFVEIARRAERYGIPLGMFEFYAIPTSPATYELIRKVYELMGWDVYHILFIEGLEALDVNNLVEITIEQQDGCQRRDDSCVFHNWTGVKLRREYGIDHIEIPSKTADDEAWNTFTAQAFDDAFEHVFDSIEDRELHVAARDTWSRMKPTIEKFDYAISNPPYQLQIGVRKTGQPHNKSVYGDFQKFALSISDNTAYIYPSGWQGSIETGFGKWLLENGLYSFNHYNSEELFETIRKRYPIGIATCKKNYQGEIKINDMMQERTSRVWYRDALEKSLVEKTSDYTNLSLSAEHITELRNIEESDLHILSNQDSADSATVNIYIKETAGPRADGGEHHISYTEALKYFTKEDIDLYKCAVPWSHFVQSRSFLEIRDNFEDTFTIKVYPKNYVFAQTWMKIASFESLEKANNFAQYLNTKISTRLIAMYRSTQEFALLVPDLEDYTNNNPIFTPNAELPDGHEYKGLSLDERLYKLFKLTEEEIAIINQS